MFIPKEIIMRRIAAQSQLEQPRKAQALTFVEGARMETPEDFSMLKSQLATRYKVHIIDVPGHCDVTVEVS